MKLIGVGSVELVEAVYSQSTLEHHNRDEYRSVLAPVCLGRVFLVEVSQS